MGNIPYPFFIFMTIDICKHCKKEFIKNRKDKVFCSKKCKVKSKDKRLERRKKKLRLKIKLKKHPYIIYKGDRCSSCGFIPINPCQLDVDHIDGDHNNNALDNLQTLCANCHRLKTYLQKDWKI